MAGIPANLVKLPDQNPLPYGLYDAAIVQDVPTVRGGILIETDGVTSGQWDTACEPSSPNTPKTGASTEPFTAGTFGVWAAHECKTVGFTDETAVARAVAALRVREPLEAEKHLAARLAAASQSVNAADILAQVGEAEKALAATNTPGVVHAARWLLPAIEKAGGVIRQGQALFTPGGHRWVFGSGYGALGASIAATGRVVVQRDPVASSVTTALNTNTRLAVAERTLAIGVEAPVTLVKIGA